MSHYEKHVFVCTNQKAPGKKCCAEGGGDAAFEQLKNQLLEQDLFGPGKIRVSKSGCLGRCSSGPCVVVYPEGTWYRYQDLNDINAMVNDHLKNDKIVQHLLID